MNNLKQQETTLVQRACTKVSGFKALYKRLEKKIIVSGKSTSTLNNYMRCISHVALHFNHLPHQLDIEQIEEYLLMVKKKNTTASESFFKHTVYGLRFLFRCEGLDDQAIKLPKLKRDKKLPVVLGRSEMKALLKAPELLKHRVLLGILYGCGLRCQEVRTLLIKEVDFERNMIHVRQSMSPVFRARFVSGLRQRINGLDKKFYNDLFKTNWVVYAKQAFGGPGQVIEYLGRYTHKVAISNHRILHADDQQVRFKYKEYRQQGKSKVMSLDAMEFIRRFSMHILPKGFMRIRHFGILSSSRKQKTLPLIHQQFHSDYTPIDKTVKKDWKQISIEMGFNPDCCPVCKKQTMITLLTFDRRGPPDNALIKSLSKKVLAKSHSQI